MKSPLNCLITAGLLVTFSVVSQGASIVGTDFTGRTVSGNTASNITWTVTGITDPGDLTAIENESNGVNDGTTELTGLFDTAAAVAGHFAPDLNIDNEDSWYVDVALNFAASTASLSITTLDLSITHFTNTGDAQGNTASRSDWRAEIIGSTSGVVATDSALDAGGSYFSGPYAVPLDLTSSLNSSETWTLRIYSDYNGGVGNNTAFDSFTLNGTVTPVPEPSTILLGALGALALLRRHR